MSYSLELINEGNPLFIQTGETVTAAEFAEINEQILMYSRQASGTFHLIANMLATQHHPNNVLELKRAVQWTREPNIGWVIYLSNNHYLNIVMDTIMNMHGQSYLVLDDVDAALAIVALESSLQ